MTAIGIDLGTTNSVACFYDGQRHRVLLNSHNEELTPSVVGYEPPLEAGEEGAWQVGRTAVNQAKLFPENTVYSIKRLMGKRYADEKVRQWADRVPYRVVESGEPVRGRAAVRIGDQAHAPEDVSARILQEIKRYSETILGRPVTHAVITVPAYFLEPEKEATREAGRRAGLVVKTLLPEPTAAAVAYGFEPREPAAGAADDGKFLLVFDLGGGTFDISLISLVATDFNVFQVSGDRFLGGDDFDARIVDLIVDHVREKHQLDLAADPLFRVVAKEAAELAKKSLSNPATEAAPIVLPAVATAAGRTVNVRLKVTRDWFEAAIRPDVERCRSLVREALREKGLTADVISDVLLVGGSTAVPAVYRMLAEEFGEAKLRREINPMHGVAIGAAIHAHHMRGVSCPTCGRVYDEAQAACPVCNVSLAAAKAAMSDGVSVTDITSAHFGIQAVAGADPTAFEILVEKSQPLPMGEPRRRTFYTLDEGQTRIRVPVYEGVGRSVTQNTRIGEIQYDLPTQLPKGHPVNVEFRLDRHAIVNVVIEADGVGHRWEGTLSRDLSDPPPEEPLIPEDDGDAGEGEKALARLESYAKYGRDFLTEYARLLSPPQQKKLADALATADEVLAAEDEAAAPGVLVDLHNLLLVDSPPASLIAQGRLAADVADRETAAAINQASDLIRAAHREQRFDAVERHATTLASLIRQVNQRREEVQPINTTKKTGLLGTHPSAGGAGGEAPDRGRA